ncbi:RAD55 family ATPase [Halohasta litorea]|jgi:KaiC/GvpD/RAD55 family RecA-like ATPase|uniref:RAD55 family ATPase n=1 Tax=Halohasta litorea TaxID=869891 RepID=A0ABD6DAA0_9EURY|nr:transcriptional regulator [Halohasta litorea]MEA1929929.1 transcriptional regulator [Euryarchaeota archaeon]
MSRRLSTGIDVLDRQLDGGIPTGSIVLFSADPASQSELLLYEVTAVRMALYLTTIRSDQAVQDALDRTSRYTNVGEPTIRDIGVEAPLDQGNKLLGTLPTESTLIVDTLDPLERQEASRYRYFLNQLQTQMRNTESIAILHAMEGRSVPELRDVTEHMADVVFKLNTEVQGTEIVNRLSVPKFRGGRALDETIKLKLSTGVSIDTSRDIA